MSSKDQNLSEQQFEVRIENIQQIKIGIVVSKWNDDITSVLSKGCKDCLTENGVLSENICVSVVPGAYELPLGAKFILAKDKVDAVICIGCIIKGETKHDEYIAHAVSNGIMNLGLTSSKPVIFGVLTPNSHAQALDRSGGNYGNKGVEAALTALRMIEIKDSKPDNAKSIGF